jgi:hypothetical protein
VKTPSPKLRVYETLQALNHGFEQVLIDLGRLHKLGSRPAFLNACRVIVEETRAWTNFEVVEVLQRREQNDWERFSRLRREAEKPLEDPNDVLIRAEPIKPPRAKAKKHP